MRTREDIRGQLKYLKIKLQEKYPIATMAMFGSYSRNEQNVSSDIDLLVEFDGKIGSGFIALADDLERELGQKVDLVSKNGIKEKYLNQIKSDLIYV